MRTWANVLLFLFGTILLTDCEGNKRNDSISSDKKMSNHADSIELILLIRDIYKWYETDGANPDFYYSTKDSFLTGMDWTKNNERFEKIEKTGFFDKTFLDNLNQIARQIDGYIKNDTAKFETTLMPPWLDGANDWCNCQMTPENYWETMIISDLRNYGDSVDLKWTWGHDFYYNLRAKKVNGKWRVSYLQGLDKKDYEMR
jgi:hypothetical protein